MDTPDVNLSVAPPIPSSLSPPNVIVEPSGVGENEANRKGKRMNYQNWEIATIIYGCNAACVAKPQSTVQFRAQYLREHYEKFARQCLRMYGLTEGVGGTYTVAQSCEYRTALSSFVKTRVKVTG